MLFFVFAQAYALLWLFVYGHAFLKLGESEFTRAQTDTGGTSPAGAGLIDGNNTMRFAAGSGIRRVAGALAMVVVALTEWFPVKRPLSIWEIMFAGENIFICLLLVVLIVKLEKIRRLYRRSARSAQVAAQGSSR